MLAALLKGEIEAGIKYPPGAALPSYRKLASDHDIAVNTAQAAVQILAAEGLVEIRAASGAYVRDPAAAPASEPDLRAEVTEIRNRLRQTIDELSATEQAVTGLLGRLPPGSPTH